jgi:RNA polymerase sigma-70 factor, ECF subfamily
MEDSQPHKPLSEREREAFDELYRMHRGRVYSICLKMTRNASESEDLTQEVFIKLFSKIEGFRGEAAFTTWLHRVTVNQVLMHFRRRKLQPEITAEEENLPAQIVSVSTNSQQTRIADRILLSEAMAKLPIGCLRAVVLHDIAGLEHDEIAALRGKSAGTSKSQLHKARARLREVINQSAPMRLCSLD